MYKYFIYIALLLCTVNLVFGLHFHIRGASKKCFFMHIPDETVVVVNYTMRFYDPLSTEFMPSSLNVGMYVGVRDSNDNVLSHVYSSNGGIIFTSLTPGEHAICMYSDAWLSRYLLRIKLDIKVGERAIDYVRVAQKERLTEPIELRVRQLLAQAKEISNEQRYFLYRTNRSNMTSQSTKSRIVWCLFTQTVVFIALGFWQMQKLKKNVLNVAPYRFV